MAGVSVVEKTFQTRRRLFRALVRDSARVVWAVLHSIASLALKLGGLKNLVVGVSRTCLSLCVQPQRGRKRQAHETKVETRMENVFAYLHLFPGLSALLWHACAHVFLVPRSCTMASVSLYPLASLDQIEKSPSHEDGLLESLEEDLRAFGCKLIHQAGVLLKQ